MADLIKKQSRSADSILKIHQLITIPVAVNGKLITGTIDTGASLTLINAQVAASLKLEKRVVKGIYIKIISGEKEEARELSEVTIVYEDSSITIECYIIQNLPVDLLLGLNWLYASKAKLDFSRQDGQLSTEFTLRQEFACLLDAMEDTFHLVADHRITPYYYQSVEIQASRPITGTYTLIPNVVAIPGINIPACQVILRLGHGRIIVKNYSCRTIVIRKETTLGTIDEDPVMKHETTYADPPPWEAPDKRNELKINPSLNEIQKKDLNHLINKYSELFSPLTKFGQVKDFTFTINLRENFTPFSSSPYEKTEMDRKLISSQVNEMLKFDVIRKCDKAEFCSPVFTVPKRDGGRRIVVDFRKLNQETVDLRWPIPSVPAILDALSNNKYFTTLDMRSGYWQVPLAEKDKSKTAFITHLGTYEYNVLPFGLKCAPAFFQHMVDSILDKLVWNKCVAYIDDMFILGKTWKEHVENCEAVFEKLNNAKLKTNLNKSEFGFNEVDYLGHHITPKGISPASKNIAPIINFPAPKTVKETKSFLGMANFYRTFIPEFASIAEPLNNLTRKDVPFEWSTECEETFQRIKTAISSQPVLAYFDERKEIRVYTDACKNGIGGILNQVHEGKERLVACVSRCTSRPEKNYSITELEGLAVVWTLTKLRHYLIGREFTIFTDHHALCYIIHNQPMQPKSKQLRHNDKMVRWLLRLGDFKFTVIHRSGVKIPHADCVSRVSLPIDPNSEPDDLPIFLDEKFKDLRTFQEEELSRLERFRPDLCKFIENDGFIYLKEPNEPMRLFIPLKYREEVLKILHDDSGHLGRNKVQEKAKKRFYWHRINKDIEEYINNCSTCQMHAFRKRKQQFPLQPIINTVSEFLELVGVDAIGPLPMTFRGYKYALVMIDYFTKWAEAAPVKNITAEVTVKFYKQVFSHIGTPRSILSDNGSNFAAEETEKYLKEEGINHIRATAYHPETNGLCERLNKTIKHVLSKLLNERPKSDWDLLLNDVLWHYNTSIQETTRLSPYYMVYKKEPELAIDRKLPTYSPRFNPSKLRQDFAGVRKNLNEKAWKMHANYGHNKLELQVGDWVKWFPPYRHPKVFEMKAVGPFIVIEKICPTTYMIQSTVDESIKRAHVNSLEKITPKLASEQDKYTIDRSSRGGPVRIDDLGHDLSSSLNDEYDDEPEKQLEEFGHYSQSDSDEEEGFNNAFITLRRGSGFMPAELSLLWQEGPLMSYQNLPGLATQGLNFDQVNISDLLNASSDGDDTNLTEEIRLILQEKKRMLDGLNRTYTLSGSHQFDDVSTKLSPEVSYEPSKVSPNSLNQTVLWNTNHSKRDMKHQYYKLVNDVENEERNRKSFGTSTPTERRVTWAIQDVSPLTTTRLDTEERNDQLGAVGGLEAVEDLQHVENTKLDFTVEAIIGDRVRSGETEYLLKWQNYDTPSWNSKKNMKCDRLIKEYEKQKRQEKEEKEEKRRQRQDLDDRRRDKSNFFNRQGKGYK